MKTKIFLVILAAQTAFLLATTAIQEHALRTGKVILLETAPVDPRDFLRGDYAILNYKISTLPNTLLSPSQDLRPGSTIYVLLEPKGELYQAIKASGTRLSPAANQVLVKGRIEQNWWPGANNLTVQYGIERYYVPEGRGNFQGKLTVEAAVSSSGSLSIKRLFVNGTPVKDL